MFLAPNDDLDFLDNAKLSLNNKGSTKGPR